ncbi:MULTISPECIES: hypothetical protein [unclassified Streptomyces]|uniref:hypothetical protein n=1 Tax=unclassified Streptomyces TaxID=2593676 RepID=UPI0036E638E0
MAVARRLLLTATAAGTVLTALWFVPSANATDEPAGATGTRNQQAAAADTGSGPRLADTGAGTDTTPYLIGGTAFLGIGAAFVTHSARRAGAPSV